MAECPGYARSPTRVLVELSRRILLPGAAERTYIDVDDTVKATLGDYRGQGLDALATVFDPTGRDGDRGDSGCGRGQRTSRHLPAPIGEVVATAPAYSTEWTSFFPSTT